MTNKLTPKNLPWYGHGGTDITDEWRHNGNYYTTISRSSKQFGSNHNYHADIYVKRSGRRYKKIGYQTRITQCLTASNSKEIVLQEWVIYRTLIEAKQAVCDFINAYDNEIIGPQIIIGRYLKEKAQPVVAFIDGTLTLLGTTYGNMGGELMSQENTHWKDLYLYYHDDQVNYRYIKADESRVYTINDRGWGDEVVGFDTMQPISSGYSGGGTVPEDRAKLIPQILEVIKDDGRFSNLYWKLFTKLKIANKTAP